MKDKEKLIKEQVRSIIEAILGKQSPSFGKKDCYGCGDAEYRNPKNVKPNKSSPFAPRK